MGAIDLPAAEAPWGIPCRSVFREGTAQAACWGGCVNRHGELLRARGSEGWAPDARGGCVQLRHDDVGGERPQVCMNF
jgi:hypothetical protein